MTIKAIFTPKNGRSPRRNHVNENKSCEFDAIPTNLLKEILSPCIETITRIVNTSLTKEIFANNWKTAIVHPLLKIYGLDLLMNKYRPLVQPMLPFQAC